MSASRVRASAAAKVNLWLRVFGRDARGYHAIESLFQLLSLADHLVVERASAGVRLVGAPPELGPPEQNLAVRVAHRFLAAARVSEGVVVTLSKRVPWSAGLGGGSSDAAAVLAALDLMFEHPLARGDLLQLGAGVGSDVPFFLCGSPLALAWGRGERLLALPPLPSRPVLVVPPPSPVRTADAYSWLDKDRGRTETTGEWAAVLPPEALRTWEDVRRHAHNDFEPAVAGRLPEIGHWLDRLRATSPLVACLAGSGGALVAVYASDAQRDAAWQALGADPAILRERTLEEAPALLAE